MKKDTPELLKFKLLRRDLDVPTPLLVGLLELLWNFTARNAPRGDVGRFSNEAIAVEAGWEGDPDAFIAALVRRNWLDVSEPHRLVVHDWFAHCPRWVTSKLHRAGLDFAGVYEEDSPEDPDDEGGGEDPGEPVEQPEPDTAGDSTHPTVDETALGTADETVVGTVDATAPTTPVPTPSLAQSSLVESRNSRCVHTGPLSADCSPPPDPGPPQRTRKPRAKPKPKPSAHPDRRAVIDEFHGRYLAAYGEKPSWQAKQRDAAERIAKRGLDAFRRKLAVLFDSPPDWLKPPFTIGTLDANWDALVPPERLPARTARGSNAPPVATNGAGKHDSASLMQRAREQYAAANGGSET